MTSLTAQRLCPDDGAHDAAPDPAAPGDLLGRFRLSALACRAAARTDLFEACAVLSAEREVARTADVEVLIRCLAQALGKRPVFHRPGAPELSFDEAWLMQLIDASGRNDIASLTFLIWSRVRAPARRNLAFLIHRISERSAVV